MTEKWIERWPEESRKAAQLVIDPDERILSDALLAAAAEEGENK